MFGRRVKFWVAKLVSSLANRFRSKTAPSIGAVGEKTAAAFLRKKGMRIITSGYRERFGEIDLIAVDNRVVVFVEVKTRHTDIAGAPESAVDKSKQQKIIKTASSYLKRHDLFENSCRFDVVAITLSDNDDQLKIEHFENAFRLEESDPSWV